MTSDAREVKWNDVEWRVDGQIDNGGGCRVVPYLDAPTVARYLDGWVGPFNWRDEYEAVKQGALWCHLEVREPGSDEWIRKTDLGTASNFEPDKGIVSDAFKRVAMRKWRIGANVLDLPNIRLQRGQFDTYESKGKTHARLSKKSQEAIMRQLQAQGYTDAAEHARVNTKGEDARSERGAADDVVTGEVSGEPAPSAPTPTPPAVNGAPTDQSSPPITNPQVKAIHTLTTNNGIDDPTYRAVLFDQFGVRSSKDLTRLQAGEFIDLLSKAPRREAALRAVREKAGA